MIGRVLYAAFAVSLLATAPVTAAPASATHVIWHRNGVLTWEVLEHRIIAEPTVLRVAAGLPPSAFKVIAHGSPGLLEIRAECAQRDGGPVHRTIIGSRVVRAPRPRIVAVGAGGTPLQSFEAHGLVRMSNMARSAIEMLATAYTADSAGGDGMTALGRRAGFGIVAVDPRLIPLGTRLYIPGYGLAIAGDTGGDIVGRRIDLGFDSLRDAMLFGKRSVKVYRFK